MSTIAEEIDDAAIDRKAMHNIIVLTFAQSFNFALAPLTMAVGGLTGSYLLDADKSLATLPITFFILGPLFAAFPAAMLMRAIGRRNGFLVGAVLGFCSCGFAAYTVLHASFWLFCLSCWGIGASTAFAQQYRFAAADFGSKAMRTRGLSWVMGGGLLAALIGPQTALYFQDFFPLVVFAGCFVGGMLLCAIGFLVLLFLRPPPVDVREEVVADKPTRPVLDIIKQPLFLTAFLCAAMSYMSMSLVMTAAPLAMALCGFGPEQSTLAIQLHIMAMFAPSFFTGSLILKFGHAKIIGLGMVLFGFASAAALAGIELANFWAALIALGLAWNFGYVGGTSLVTRTYEPHERNKVQGIFDSMVFGLAATSSLLSGVFLSTMGWNAVLIFVVPLIIIGLSTLFTQRHRLAAMGI